MVALVVVAAVALFVVTGGFAPAGTAGSQGSAATGEATGAEAAGDDASAADAMETVDAQYGTAAQSLLAQLEQDPSNPHGPSQRGKRLLRPGAWRRSTTRPTTMAVRTRRSLLEQAIGYYDEYLAR